MTVAVLIPRRAGSTAAFFAGDRRMRDLYLQSLHWRNPQSAERAHEEGKTNPNKKPREGASRRQSLENAKGASLPLTGQHHWGEEDHNVMATTLEKRASEHLIEVPVGTTNLDGNLVVPEHARGVVLFAHGSGSSRHSPRNRFVATFLQNEGLATLLIDLLTPSEDAVDVMTAHHRFDIELLANRLIAAVDWLGQNPLTKYLAIGCFGASTGAAAALVAAAERPHGGVAVVSRGGRPDLAGPLLPRVKAPTLLVVGSNDLACIPLNRDAHAKLGSAEKQVVLVAGATHLFEEQGTLDEVARLAAEWFARYLRRPIET